VVVRPIINGRNLSIKAGTTPCRLIHGYQVSFTGGGFFPQPPFFFFFLKPYRTGRPEFTIQFRIPALQALLAQVNIVFHALIRGFSVRVIGASVHAKYFQT
jgi:hypothetical protein